MKSTFAENSLNKIDLDFSCSYFPGTKQLPEEVINQFETKQKICYEKCLANISHDLDVNYGAQYCDIWGNTNKSNTIFAFVHGGYWQYGSKKTATIIPALVANNIIVVNIGYNLAGSGQTIFEMIKQIRTAFNYLSKKFINSKICVSGHSAGALLTAKALEENNLPNIDKVILFCGIYFLSEMAKTIEGKQAHLTDKSAIELSLNVDLITQHKAFKNLLIMTAQHDAPKITEQNNVLIEKLSKYKDVHFKHEIIKNTNHFTLIEELENENSLQLKIILNFIKS